MRSYRPSGAISGGGFLLLLILAVVSGAIIGAILWAVETYAHLYLVVAFPLLGGVIAGGILGAGVRSAKVRSPLIAGLMGLIAGVVMYGTYHFASYYITFRNDIRSIYMEQNPRDTLTDEQLTAFIDEGLKSEVDDTGFVGYIKYSAKIGFTVTRTTSSVTNQSGTEFKDELAYIYWAVEILLAALAAGGMAWSNARQPFDENSNSWYGPPQVFAIAPAKKQKELVRALKDGSFQEAGSLLTRQQIKYPRIEIWTRRSPDPLSQEVMLLVKHLQRSNRPRNVKDGMVSTSELEMINKAVDIAVEPNPVVSKL